MNWNLEKIYDRTSKDYKRQTLEEIKCVLIKTPGGEEFWVSEKDLKQNPGQTFIITNKRKVIN